MNVVWNATDTTTLHIGYARYFTPPPFELVGGEQVAAFNGTSAAPLVHQDSTVKPERDNYYDVGIQQMLSPYLQVGVDAYFKTATDLIDEGQFGAPVILTAFNYAQGQDSGVEFTGSYDRGPWSIYGNLAVVARHRQGHRNRAVQFHAGRTGLQRRTTGSISTMTSS